MILPLLLVLLEAFLKLAERAGSGPRRLPLPGVLFDLEAVFIFSWAIAVEELGWPGYLAITTFILELLLALVYGPRFGLGETTVALVGLAAFE